MIAYGAEHEPPPGWELPPNVTPMRPAQEPNPDLQHRGQVRIAYRLAQAFGEQLMHVHGLGWFVWDGKRWTEDNAGRTGQAVLEVFKTALAESVDDRTLRDDVRRCETANGIRGVLEIAASLPQFARTVEELDADPAKLNTQTGVLDLATGALLPHDPALRCTKITTAAYRPGSPPDGEWCRFLHQALPDADVRGYFQRLIGRRRRASSVSTAPS